MATVFLAEDLKHHRKVAIKVLKPELAVALGAERFLREIETTANLRHPHILPLYDSGQAAEFLYYVMPFVDGESLRDRLQREKQLPIEEALQISREVADALGYAHSRGVVHRDVKPENILLEGGHAVVADFGIARAVSAAGGERLTSTGMAVGTPYYMSPEQAAAGEDVDGRSDLYSLGCVLYEMLAGQPPFTGPTAQAVTRQHLVTQAAPITDLRPTVPPSIAGALARTLAKNPADRFNPAAQFVQALTSAAQAPAPTAQGQPSAAKQPRFGALVTGLLVVAIAAAAWVLKPSEYGSRATRGVERIAVLPMDNQTGDAGQDFFADGMTRELIGVLTDAGVRVLGHRAVAPYRQSTLPAPQIAKELGVDAIVTGSVLRAGEEVQVAAELIDPATGENLWARTFSRSAAGVVSLQHEIAAEIAKGIHARLTPEQEQVLGTSRTVNPEAYAQYLLGAEQVNVRSPDGYRRALEHLHRSVALDSTFAPAWASLAMDHAVGLFFAIVPLDSAAAAEAAAARALALDPELGDALIARSMARLLRDWDFAAAGQSFEEGVRKNPSTMGLAVYAWYPWLGGQVDKAIAATSRLIDLEPTTAQWHSDMGWWHFAGGDTAAARAAGVRAISLDSTFYEPYHFIAWIDAMGRDIEAASQSLARATKLAGGDFWLRETLGRYITVQAGDTATVRKALARTSKTPLAQRALLSSAIGDTTAMYDLFGRAIDTRDPDALWMLNSFPALRPLRKDPRYQALLERMKLPKEWR